MAHNIAWIKVVLMLFALFVSCFKSACALSVNCYEPDSMKQTVSIVAQQLLRYYNGDSPGGVEGMFVAPIYWWQSGSAWNALLDYYRLTGDTTYNELVKRALIAHRGEQLNMLPKMYKLSQGNDDQAFWAFAVMSAAETESFPQPDKDKPSWLDLAKAVFYEQAERWNSTEQYCGGGLPWQIFNLNHGYNYKNAVSSNSLFLLAARLARFTGHEFYKNWAIKIWNWSKHIGFIDDYYSVFDGADISDNCTQIDKTQWTYNNGILMAGCAFMWNQTGNEIWKERIIGLIRRCKTAFAAEGSILYEPACELSNICNNDQVSFKGQQMRFFGYTIQMAPFSLPHLLAMFHNTARAAARACNGPPYGTTCGFHWSRNSDEFDGFSGMPSELSALEAIQAPLVRYNPQEIISRAKQNIPESIEENLSGSLVQDDSRDNLIISDGYLPGSKSIATILSITTVIMNIIGVVFLLRHSSAPYPESGTVWKKEPSGRKDDQARVPSD